MSLAPQKWSRADSSYHFGENLLPHFGQTYVWVNIKTYEITENITMGIAIVHHGTSMVSPNQFALHEVRHKSSNTERMDCFIYRFI